VDLIEDLGFRLRSSSCFWNQLSILKRARMEVTIHETDRLEAVLKKFRREITKAGVFQDMKKKRFFESPAVQRRRKSKAARRRNRTR
jgi:small subunit ribosomal protein S21